MRTEHDVIIIGGGVNGTGIARDCALRGIRPLVVEKHDLAKGASGANTGMIHGGIRYLRYDVHTTKVSCKDSGYIQRIAPHLLFRIPFLFPVMKGDAWGKLFLEGAEIFFEAYDVYQPLKRGKAHTRLSKADALSLEPGLSDQVVGAVTMDEWGIDPFRLVVANALDTEAHGGVVRTYCEIESFVRESEPSTGEKGKGSGAVVGIRIHDRLKGTREVHTAPVIINATGAWGPRVAALAGAEYRLRPGKGVHIVYSHRISNYGLVMMAVDGRQMFLMPHENGSIVGTTDDDYYGDLDNPRATEDEVKYILQAARRIFPAIDRYRMSRTYVGVRPTVWGWSKPEDSLSREHEFYDHTDQGAPGLLSVAGGKLAAFRQLSEEVTDLIAARVGNTKPCRTHTEPLPGAEDAVSVEEWAETARAPRLSVARMAYRHGCRAKNILKIAEEQPRTSAALCLCEPVCEAEVRYTAREEMVRRLVDVRRRTRVSMGGCGGTRCLFRASQVLAEEAGLTVPQQLLEWRDAMCGRFIGKRPVLEGANLATEELNQAMHFLSGNLKPYLEASRAELGIGAFTATRSPADERVESGAEPTDQAEGDEDVTERDDPLTHIAARLPEPR